MNRLSAVINASGDYEENIERLAIHLGKDKVRRRVFCYLYGKITKPKNTNDISQAVGSDASLQTVRNALNHLSKHHLIAKEPTSGTSRFVYSKVEFVRANKERIIRHADNPQIRNAVATKRRPHGKAVGEIRAVRRAGASRSVGRQKVAKVLLLTATPQSQHPLRTDAEVRQIQQEIRGSRHRDRISLLVMPAASPKTLIDGLNDHEPAIVHFSGHGGGSGLWFDDGKVVDSHGGHFSFDIIAELLGAVTSPPKVLILNACQTIDGADVLLDAVDAVIAMSDSITDLGAANFSAGFYSAIAAGETVVKALAQGVIGLKVSNLFSDAQLPKLLHRHDFDPSKYRPVQ